MKEPASAASKASLMRTAPTIPIVIRKSSSLERLFYGFGVSLIFRRALCEHLVRMKMITADRPFCDDTCCELEVVGFGTIQHNFHHLLVVILHVKGELCIIRIKIALHLLHPLPFYLDFFPGLLGCGKVVIFTVRL